MLHISIVIVNYNSQPDTLECLNSLSKVKSSGFKFSILIVDNGSKEAFVLPKKLKTNDIEVIRSESNLGYTGGNNMGIHYCVEKYNSDFVLLLNNDTIVDPKFLKALIDHAEKYPKAGLMSSKIYFAKGHEYFVDSYSQQELGNVLWYAGGSIDWDHLVAFHRGVDEVDRGHFDNQLESDFATGCSVLIRREVLEKVGTLDKRYFLYLEDVDLSVRAQKNGYEVHFVPQSIVWHKNANSSGGSGSGVQEYYQTRNRFIFIFKHGGWHQLLAGFRLGLNYILFGNNRQRLGIFHFLTAQFGKQPVL
ncbi:MAG: glycosyltransferase family 2 protein [Pseudomonadales bacterium]|nr:glycosyltransferase family 2 protein [Pseudomonadales bacterium]